MEKISIVAELVACMISFWICVSVLGGEFHKREHVSIRQCLLWGILFVEVTYFEIGSNLFASLLGMGICIGFAQIYFEGDFSEKLISVLRVNVLTMLIAMCSIQIVSIISGISVEILTQKGSDPQRIILICIIKSFCILTAFLYKRLLKGKSSLKKEEILICAFFSVSFFAVALFFMILLKKSDLSNGMQIGFATVVFLLFGINITVLFLLNLLHDQNQKMLENSILRTQLHEQELFIEKNEKKDEEIREFRHDIKRYFSNYLYLLEKGEVGTVIEELRKNLRRDFMKESILYTSNIMLNAIINEKKAVCEKNGIPLFVHISLGTNLESMELAIALENLLDNAIEAEQKESQKGIWLNIEVIDNMLNLIVENKIHQSVVDANPNLNTLKKNKEEHGMGIRIVRQIADQMEGFISIKDEKGKFIVHLMIPVTVFAKSM